MSEQHYLILPKFKHKELLFNLFKTDLDNNIKELIKNTCYPSADLIEFQEKNNKIKIDSDYVDSYALRKISPNQYKEIQNLYQNLNDKHAKHKLEGILSM